MARGTRAARGGVTAAGGAPRDRLLALLRGWEPAAGPDGFEGLVAQALATMTGRTFRLARSGNQFGRDAGTPAGRFSIVMEAKRYSDSVPIQELAGKATLAAFALAEGVDLWALAATVEVGEGHERMLAEILETGGISLLTLDWPATGLPPLAVALAAAKDDLLAWSTGRVSAADLAVLRAGLDDVAADSSFADAAAELCATLSPGLLGLGAFRARNDEWCRDRFADLRKARLEFSQSLAPLAAATTSIERPAVTARIRTAIEAARRDADGDTFALVLGDEGAGKSWAVARWWLDDSDRPILLLSAGRIADQLIAGEDGVDMLVRLAAHQDGRTGDAVTMRRWRRRFERWSRASPSRDRFAVVVDGLNETSGKSWATIILKLLPVVRDLGGVVIVTCRHAYWHRDVARRMAGGRAEPVEVGNYDDAEFAAILSSNELVAEELPPELDAFMRNPRVCALALTLLPGLPGIRDLTVERLLVEYWRARLIERGDLLGHDDVDFDELLRRHALEYRERPGVDFARDEWRTRSGAAQRGDGRDLANDLSDIEEGRFFRPGGAVGGRYAFRDEVVPFALGLLVADDLRGAAAQLPDRSLDELLETALDPIRGFDQVADILAAAVTIASLDSAFPSRGVSALVTGFMALQNVDGGVLERLVPPMEARPGPFLDAFEARDVDRDDGRFLPLILHASRNEEVARALDARAARWLGSWSRRSNDWGDPAEQEKRRISREQRINGHLAELTTDERAWFDAHCPETERAGGLAIAAALHLFGRPQADIAEGVVAFAFASAVAGDYRSGYEEVAWAVRLNRLDHARLAEAVRAAIRPFAVPEASTTARDAAGTALRLVGAVADQAEAARLSPPSPDRYFPRAETDPLDPASVAPEGISEIAARLDGIDPAAVWTGMGATMDDHEVERRHLMLARFAPERLSGYLDRLARTVGIREGMPLRQLGWRLPWLSPLLAPETVTAIVDHVAAIGVSPELVPAGDEAFVTGMLVEAAFPHLEADGQLDLLQSLRAEAPYYLRYNALAKPLPPGGATRRLMRVRGGDKRVEERTLLFLASTPGEVDEALRTLLIECLTGEEEDIRAVAADYARRHPDDALDDAVLQLDPPDPSDRSWGATLVTAATATAVVRRSRADLLDRVAGQHLDWVAAALPEAVPLLADMLEAAIDRLARPVAAEEPEAAMVVLELDGDGIEGRFDLTDPGEQHANPLEALNAELGDDSFERFDRRRELMGRQFERFLETLELDGARFLAQRPPSFGLDRVVRAEPDRVADWLRRILDIRDDYLLRNLQAIGFNLARSYAAVDGALAASVFSHLWSIEPGVTVVLGRARLPIRDLALFGSPWSAEIDRLRARSFEEAADDGRIQTLALAADQAGAGQWLDNFIDERAVSPLPADQALALTVASFRSANIRSGDLLDRDWGGGFVGGVATVARRRYRRAGHADHWFERARSANDPADRWRFLELAIGAADRRHVVSPDAVLAPRLRAEGGDVPQRLGKAAKKAENDAAKMLFGGRKPDGLLARLLGR